METKAAKVGRRLRAQLSDPACFSYSGGFENPPITLYLPPKTIKYLKAGHGHS